MAKHNRSPLTTVRCCGRSLAGIDFARKNSTGIFWFPSIRRQSGVCRNDLSALPIASRLALRILRRSISSTSTMPSPQVRAFCLIMGTNVSRWLGLNTLESLMSGCEKPRGRTTAAATTGPASGPRPTSSNPATHLKPREYTSFSITPGREALINSSDNDIWLSPIAFSFS